MLPNSYLTEITQTMQGTPDQCKSTFIGWNKCAQNHLATSQATLFDESSALNIKLSRIVQLLIFFEERTFLLITVNATYYR